MQGTACAYDLARFANADQIILADVDRAKAEQAAQRVRQLTGHTGINAQSVNVEDHDAVIAFLTLVDVLVSAVPYFYNERLTDAAIAAGSHMVDMGGNTDLVFRQRKRSDAAAAAGVTILPDAGLAPGLANIIAAHAIGQMDHVEALRIRVGGLPQHPKPPMNYQMFFSMHGLINEYMGESVVLRNGRIEKVPTLTEVEALTFRDPIGACEAFHTLGGISTLPWTYEGQIQEMDYKTIRYPGHCAQVKLLADLGLLDEEAVSVNGSAIRPRDLFAAVATPRLTFEETEDIVLVRIIVDGERAGEALRLTYEIVEPYDADTGFTAMMRTTAYPVAILAQMLADGRIAARGVLPLETTVPTAAFLTELEKRQIRLWMDTLAREEAHSHC
jgi:lysine 6-dehydrogenase